MDLGPLPIISRKAIQAHYDWCSWWYASLWGEHIHHGYWEDGETPEVAQVKLIQRLANACSLGQGGNVLDAGCGLGGSSIWMARERGCRVLGVTLSSIQARMARTKVEQAGVSDQVTILKADLEQFAAQQGSLDLVWSIECTEHFRDKAGFFAKAATWLRPGGRIALCAWTRGEDVTPYQWHRYVEPVCRGFLCPSLGSASEYRRWLEESGMVMEEEADLTSQTMRTWELCLERTSKPWVRLVALLMGRETLRFLDSFSTILDAYRSGAMRYSLIVARKPGAP